MVLFNHATREMTAKIVYYGPGLCGKTTNLLVIFDKLESDRRGKMLSLATKTDRTLFFDLLPVDIGKVGPFNLKIQLYTVPGQVFYNETRKLVLKGADAVVFVVDSQPSMVDSNRESFENLMENLEENQIDSNEIPIIIQFNKRDIPGVLPVERLQGDLGFDGYPFMEASALKGDGVMETFKLATKVTAKYLLNKVSGKPLKKREKSWEAPKPAPAPVASPTPMLLDDPLAAMDELPMNMNPFTSSLPLGSLEMAPIPPVESFEEPEEIDEAESVEELDLVDDSGSPFPDAPGGEYEHVEEVSLEQLLEGRERPATMSGNIAIPVFEAPDEVEDLEPPVAVMDDGEEAADEGPSGGTSPSIKASVAEIAQLRAEVDAMREEQRKIVESLQRVVAELTTLLRG
ncbi:MAG: GTPase domain-containing protein [Thermoanaerobaculia bacterium]|jgi:signal recognition particle receptor subunit beta